MRPFRVSSVRFVYRAFASYIVRLSCCSCEAFVRCSFVSFAFFVRLRFVRIVKLYDPGSVCKGIEGTPCIEKVENNCVYANKLRETPMY